MLKDDFREALACWATGVAVVTTEGEGQKAGLTATSFTSVSLDPPLVLVCVDLRAESCEVLRRASHFGVSLLAAEQSAIALRMAGRGSEKFVGLPFFPGPGTGQPLLEGALAQLECRLFRVDDGGDHIIVLGEVLAAYRADKAPLLYYQRRFGALA